MPSIVYKVRDARAKYGFTFKEAYEYVKGQRDSRGPIDSRRHINQIKINSIWFILQYPYGRWEQPHKIIGSVPCREHIPIKCSICGAMGTTKNISPLGCSNLFIDCDCPVHYINTVEEPLTRQDFEAKI